MNTGEKHLKRRCFILVPTSRVRSSWQKLNSRVCMISHLNYIHSQDAYYSELLKFILLFCIQSWYSRLHSRKLFSYLRTKSQHRQAQKIVFMVILHSVSLTINFKHCVYEKILSPQIILFV